MLLHNLWTEAGLTNGVRGTVLDIIYASHQTPGKDLPTAVLVDFGKNYRGPRFNSTLPRGVVPIVTKKKYDTSGKNFRVNVPLDLAWGLTFHKSQGLTLDAVHLDLGSSEPTAGTTYVGISRARRLRDICLRATSVQRLQSLSLTSKKRVMSVWNLRLGEIQNLEDKSNRTIESFLLRTGSKRKRTEND